MVVGYLNVSQPPSLAMSTQLTFLSLSTYSTSDFVRVLGNWRQ